MKQAQKTKDEGQDKYWKKLRGQSVVTLQQIATSPEVLKKKVVGTRDLR